MKLRNEPFFRLNAIVRYRIGNRNLSSVLVAAVAGSATPAGLTEAGYRIFSRVFPV